MSVYIRSATARTGVWHHYRSSRATTAGVVRTTQCGKDTRWYTFSSLPPAGRVCIACEAHIATQRKDRSNEQETPEA